MNTKNKLFRSQRILLAVIVIAGLVACAPAPPETLYKVDPGALQVQIEESIVLTDPQQERDVVFRVIYPDGAGPFPLVVFSSGMFCFPQMYDRITAHWVSHGYIVVLPNHLDSPNLGKIKPEYLAKLLSARVRDMSFALDSLDEIETRTGLAGKIDRERIGVAGHSFGGMISMVKFGLALKDGEYIYAGSTADDRFQAAIVMSGVGPMKQMVDGAFGSLTGPLIATGGTLDVGNVGTGEIFPYEWRMSPYTLSPAGDKYSVVLENGDHYLGGLICREGKGGDPDPEGVAIDRAMSTAFLDAYLKDESTAKRFLQTADIQVLTGGRAEFQRK
jgi:hypothetical protein